MSVEGWNQKPSALAQPDCSAAFDRVAKQSVLSGQFGLLLAAEYGGLREALPAEWRFTDEAVFEVDGHTCLDRNHCVAIFPLSVVV